MKNLSLFVSAVALLSVSSAFAEINCGKLPSCAELGYVDKISQCPSMASPEGRSKEGYVIQQRQYLRCPFSYPSVWADIEVKCLHPAAVGQIGYFTANPGRGWILCDGQAVSRTKYPQLAALLDNQFGGSSSTFNVPDYRGYFLRVYGTPNNSMGKVGNTSLTAPQKEGLPNILGYGGWAEDNQGKRDYSHVKGAFQLNCSTTNHLGSGDSDTNNCTIDFNASKWNTIYGSSSGVTPPNYAVQAYIYAGLTVE